MAYARYSGGSGSVLGGLGCLGGIILMIAAWITHIVYCIANGAWIILIAGALVFPVGIIHGIMVWFGHGMPGGQ